MRSGGDRLVRGARAIVSVVAAGALAGMMIAGRPALARTTRPLFEPTDLELEDRGVAELDLQIGGIRSQGPWRAVMPDFELDLGLLPGLELDLDGAYAIEGPTTGPFSFDHAAPDSLWPCAKIGLYDAHDGSSRSGLAVGVQVGPKLPVAPGAHGIGVESLMLVGGARGHFHAVVNAGGFVEPAPSAGAARPAGLEVGLDLEEALDAAERFSLTGELSAVRFVSPDPNQLLATAGFTWSALESLDLSVTGLLGFLAGSDKYGVLLGVSPKLRLFGGARPSATDKPAP
ncbi:MAG TPA: hypothetical protein VIU64_09695 [Polyangia bacterium]